MAEHEPQPDDRPRPKYGELAPPGWVWRPPADAHRLDTDHLSPAASTAREHEGRALPPAPDSPQQRAVPPRWNLTMTVLLILVGFFGMTYSIGSLQTVPVVMQLMHSEQHLAAYVPAPSVGPLITAGSVVLAGIWAVSTGLSVWLLVQRRRAFYVPLVAGVIALVVLFLFVGAIAATDPVLLQYYSGVPGSPSPSSPAPSTP